MKAKSKKPCYASKGLPRVPGKPKGTDIIPAWLTPGEAVLSPGAAEMLGRGNVQALNKAASTMRLGTPQYKAEGEDEMVQGMDSAMLGNQRADEILSNPDMFNSREVQAANRYMDPAGLAGGPSPIRDQAFLGGTRSLESITNPVDDETRQQLTQAQQGLFGGNQPRRLGNAGIPGLSEGLSAAQEAVGSALSYGRQAAQDAIEEGQRARYMAQGGIVQPGYYSMGTSMVLGNRPMYMAQGGMLDDNRLRQGRDPGVTQAMQSYPVQKPVAPAPAPTPVMQRAAELDARPGSMSSINRGIDAAKTAYQNTAPQFGPGAGYGAGLREGVGAFRQSASEQLQNRLQPVGNAMQEASNFVGALAGRNPAQQAGPQSPGRVGTGFNPAIATAGLANRGSYGADIANATGKPSSSSGPDSSGIYNLNTKTGGYDRAPELARLKTDPRTGSVATDRNGFASLEFINKAARDMVLGTGAREQQMGQASPIQPNNSRSVFMGGLRMPWNVGDMVTMKDNGISYMGVAKPDGFSQTSGMTLPFLMRDPGIRASIEAQNSMYTSNKSLADANDSNAQAAIRPMQGLNYLGNVMRDTSMARAQDSQADLNEAILKNPELFSGRLGGRGAGGMTQSELKSLGSFETDAGKVPMMFDPASGDVSYPDMTTGMQRKIPSKSWLNNIDPATLDRLNAQFKIYRENLEPNEPQMSFDMFARKDPEASRYYQQ